MGCKILKRVSDLDHAPLRDYFSLAGWDCIAVLSLKMKFEVSRCTRYEAMNGGAKCRKWGGSGSLKIIDNVTIR